MELARAAARALALIDRQEKALEKSEQDFKLERQKLEKALTIWRYAKPLHTTIGCRR